MKWIRNRGIALFGIAVGVLAVLLILFVDDMIESAIEKTGTSLVRARVDLRGADLSFFPLGLRLSKLQVTDPDNPMTNAVEVDNIRFSMDTWNLMRRKVIVEEMALEGLRFKTPRKKSGAIRKASPGTQESAEGGKPGRPGSGLTPSIKFPNPKSILEKEPLPSLDLVRSTRTDLKNSRENWKDRLQELPDKKTWEGYRKRIEALKGESGGGLKGLLGGAGDAANLRKDITTDLNRLKETRGTLKTDIGGLRERAEKAARAPLEDINNLKNKYGLSPEGLSNLSRGLFGKKIGEWTETALRWYGRLSPVLENAGNKTGEEEDDKPVREKGVDIHFDEEEPLPDFLVRAANLSAEFPFGKLKGNLKNLTTGPAILGKPATFSLAGEELADLQSITIAGKLNHVNPGKAEDTVTLKVKGLALNEKSLSDSDFIPAVLKKGVLNLEGNGRFSGGTIEGVFDAGAKGVRIETPLGEETPPVQRALASALTEIREFHVKTRVSGTPDNYSLGITSDLDRVLKDAVGRLIQKEAARFESQLKAAVLEKTEGEIAGLRSDLTGLNAIDKEIASRINLGDDLLSELAKGGIKGLKLPFGK